VTNFPIKKFLAKPGEKVDLSKIDPASISFQNGQSRKDVKIRLKELNKELSELQQTIWAQAEHRVLVVLQAMDAGGKDGSIKKVFTGLNPAGVRVESFKKPSRHELEHDYLWRVHNKSPRNGEITVFNRSHYEDVLVVRVLDLVKKSVWSKRYQQIIDFERLLNSENTTVIKLFLHISKDEQKARLQDRLDVPEKNWKFKSRDLEHRAIWDEYQNAFEDAISHTSTEFAPWYIIPANRKWYRDLVISEIMVQTLKSLKPEYPVAEEDTSKIIIPD